jgi:hypothetical protein
VATKKNSLVGNINKRKKAGKSRPKSRSTVSSESYEKMQEGWPNKKKKAGAKKKKASAKKKAGAKKKKAGAKKKRAGAKK